MDTLIDKKFISAKQLLYLMEADEALDHIIDNTVIPLLDSRGYKITPPSNVSPLESGLSDNGRPLVSLGQGEFTRNYTPKSKRSGRTPRADRGRNQTANRDVSLQPTPIGDFSVGIQITKPVLRFIKKWWNRFLSRMTPAKGMARSPQTLPRKEQRASADNQSLYC